MDPDNNKGQLRQFKDFLQLYNTITEKCFSSCVDNLFTRDVSESEVYFNENIVFNLKLILLIESLITGFMHCSLCK